MFKEVIEFCKIVGRLKKIRRIGWVGRAGIQNPESVADHTFRTAVIAMVVADIKKLNAERMVRMALLHDVSEAVIGDIDRLEKKNIPGLERKEDEAVESILSLLPEELRKMYTGIWKEFVNQETEEARLVKEIDRLELLVQALEYEREGYDKNRLEVFWKTTKHLVKDPELKKLVELLEKERPAKRT